jgi:hypothetical protein
MEIKYGIWLLPVVVPAVLMDLMAILVVEAAPEDLKVHVDTQQLLRLEPMPYKSVPEEAGEVL